MDVKVWISEMQFNDDTTIELSMNDIVVFVGPNNAGKSISLKEAAALLQNKKSNKVIFKDISIEKEGDENALESSIESISIKKLEKNNGRVHYQGLGYDLYIQQLGSTWSNHKNGLANLFPFFATSLTTESRLNAASPPNNIKLTTDPPTHPIHFLQKNAEIEKKFSNYFRQAFGTDLIVHRNAGNEVPLYIGEKPVLRAGADRVSESYLNDLEKLDLLHHQGDGMRSFVGVLLYTFNSNHSIVFIDEPEAFLHPPQARLLGKMLAKDLPSQRQLFLATHSEDFLKGLLDSANANLKIIRIQRKGEINKIRNLNNTDISNIWSDSLLRHSNVLNGLFHSKVIVCESDADCRFYSAITSAIYDTENSISPDILFLHCGGKHRIPTAVRALAKLDVNVRVVADFDILNGINPLKNAYEELGGAWEEIEGDWKIVKASIDQKRPELETLELKKEIEAIFDSTIDKNFPKGKIVQIENALRKASPWAHAKEIGKSFIPNADPTKAYERLNNKLIQRGLYIVEVGQLESFVKSVGDHGPKWVNNVMTKDLKTDSELEVARRFIQRVINQ
jgi:energy-coupling factor transporter ATP-binding protein EcfA2